MLEQVRAAIGALPPGPVGLIGSSLGGFVAIHAAASEAADAAHPIARLVLLAPAVDFASGTGRMADGRRTGASGARRAGVRSFITRWADPIPLHFGLYEDGHRFDRVRRPIRRARHSCSRGRRTRSCTRRGSRQWAASRGATSGFACCRRRPPAPGAPRRRSGPRARSSSAFPGSSRCRLRSPSRRLGRFVAAALLAAPVLTGRNRRSRAASPAFRAHRPPVRPDVVGRPRGPARHARPAGLHHQGGDARGGARERRHRTDTRMLCPRAARDRRHAA